MTTSEQTNEIATACAKAQLALRPAIKDSVNPAFKGRYADLASVIQAAKVYAEHAVAVWQDVTSSDDGVLVVTRLTHSSGQWVQFGPLTVPTDKKNAHGVGSATTYAKRYALSAALGISADEDDDGNAATHSVQAKAVQAPPADFTVGVKRLTAAAEKGTAELQEVWRDVSPELRDYIRAMELAWFETLKKAAEKVTPEQVHA